MLTLEPDDLTGEVLTAWLKMRNLDVAFFKEYWDKAETYSNRGYDQTLDDDATQIDEW